MKKSIVTEIIKKLAPQIGAMVLIEPEYGFVGQITFKNGRRTLFRGSNININLQGAVEIARDKDYACFFLQAFGYRVPEGKTFFSDQLNWHLDHKRDIHDGWTYAKELGLPVIVKPNNLSQGQLVTKVYSKRDFYRSARQIFRKTAVMRVERYYSGNDYRIVVLDDRIISAYQRIPLQVIGNGKDTVLQLAAQKQKQFVSQGRDTILKLEDFRIAANLKRQALSWGSVAPANCQVILLDNANLSSGGEALDLTEELHEDFRRLAIGTTKDMGLRLCGVDIMASDATRPLKDYVVLEINAAPGLDNYAAIGQAQKQVVEKLYLEILHAIEHGGDNPSVVV